MLVKRRVPRPLGVVFALVALGSFSALAMANGDRFPGLMLLVPALLFLFRGILTGQFPFAATKLVDVDADGAIDDLRLGEKRHAVWGDSARIVRSGRVLVDPDRAGAGPVEVIVDRKGWGPPVRLELTYRAASKLVEVLGGDPAGPRRVRPGTPARATGIMLALTALLGGGFLSAEGGAPHPGRIAFPLMRLAVLVATTTVEVLIGRDGLVIQRRLSRRFIPYRDLVSVRIRRGAAASLEHVRGGRITVMIDPMLQAATVERIREGIALHRRDKAPFELRALTPPATDLASFVRKLRQNATSTYRDEIADPAALAEVLADARNQPRMRVAAAIALRAKGDDESRATVAQVAREAAEPKLRAALEEAARAEATDDDLAARLAAVAEHPAPSSADRERARNG